MPRNNGQAPDDDSNANEPAGFFASDEAAYTLVWKGLRPYLICITIDLGVTLSMWFALWAFHIVIGIVEMKTFAGEVIGIIHEVGAVAAFAIFVGMSIRNILMLNKSLAE